MIYGGAIDAAEGVSEKNPSEKEGGDGGKKLILIVEDNSLNMKLFRDVLTARGHEVVGTSRGSAALAMIEERRPDLILMDIQLSEMSGYEVIECIKSDEKKADIPVIAVTAYAMREDERKVRELGCYSYISKPIFIGPFVEEVEEALAAASQNTGVSGA